MKVAIVTLVYREPSIVETVKAWKAAMPDIPVYIFADGYTDTGYNDLMYLELNGLAHVELHEERRGFPNAMRNAQKFMYLNHKDDYDQILYVDSDGCYGAEEMKKMIELPVEGSVCGYRVGRQEADWYRKPYIWLTPKLMKFLFGFKMHDYTCAFRRLDLAQAYDAIQLSKYSRWGFWMEYDAIWYSMNPPYTEMPVHFTPMPTKIFALKKMPKILYQETIAIVKVWWHLRAVKFIESILARKEESYKAVKEGLHLE